MTRIFEKVTSGEVHVNLACRDGDLFLCLTAIRSKYNAGANRGQDGMRIFQKIFHKIEDISIDSRSISLRSVLDGVKGSRFQVLKARGPGKLCSLRTTYFKVGHVTRIFEKVTPGELYVMAALPGAEHPSGVLSHQRSEITWLVETEIDFSVLQQYVLSTTPGQIVPKVLGAFSKTYFTKSMI